MKNKKYVFAGNRAFVFQRMKEMGLCICEVWAVKGSYFEKYLAEIGLNYRILDQKEQFLKEVKETDFDVFISNGLPVILPEDVLEQKGKAFINIHPSLLPDLRGKDPVPGAILYRKDSGATCHIISKDIDSGDIISQIKIPYSEDLDAGLLYQLSFKAEADVFEMAYQRKFCPTCKQVLRNTDVYYSYKPEDMLIDLDSDSAEMIFAKINAFSTGNKGARINVGNKFLVCSDIQHLNNAYVKQNYKDAKQGILLQYEDKAVIKNVFGELFKVTVKTWI